MQFSHGDVGTARDLLGCWVVIKLTMGVTQVDDERCLADAVNSISQARTRLVLPPSGTMVALLQLAH